MTETAREHGYTRGWRYYGTDLSERRPQTAEKQVGKLGKSPRQMEDSNEKWDNSNKPCLMSGMNKHQIGQDWFEMKETMQHAGPQAIV